MVRLTCRCLNVSLHIKGKSPSYKEEKTATLGDVVGDEEESKNLHGLQLWEVALDVAGISVKLSQLLVSQDIGDWRLYKCWNCDCFTHLLQKTEPTRVLVTNKLEYNSEKIREMEKLENFSPVFKIIMIENRDREDDGEQTQFRKRVSSLNYGRDDPTLKSIHEHMKSFLQEEQDSMEERIRRFEEEQRRMYTELQTRAHKERSIIFRLITQARESNVRDTILDANLLRTSPSPNLPPRANLNRPEPTSTVTKSPGTTQRNDTKTPKESEQKTANRSSQERSPDEDDMFGDMDGFENDQDYPPFSQSDDDSAFTDDSFRDDVVEDSNSVPKMVAQSMPISMPTFRKSPKKSTLEQEDERPQISYEKMAASIQALALSCHDTGMFGELPKPRLNSIPWRL